MCECADKQTQYRLVKIASKVETVNTDPFQFLAFVTCIQTSSVPGDYFRRGSNPAT